MPINITMPALSPTMEEGNLAKWLVNEGDAVQSGDVIAEIETDKATMEVEAVDEGIIAKIVIDAGTEGVKVNSVIAILAEEGEDVGAAAATAGNASAAPTPPSVGEAAPKANNDAALPASDASAGGTANGAASASPSGERIFASPLARRIAAQEGLDLVKINGTGPHGRIHKADVEAAKASGTATASASTGASGSGVTMPAGASAESVLKLFEEGSYELIKHDGMRKTIAKRLQESKQTIPHFYVTVDCEIDALLALRAQVNSGAPEKDGKPAYKVSVNDMIIKALALSLRDVPEANVSWTDEYMVQHKHADVGVAVSIPGGLITPIVKKAEQKSLTQISMEMKDLGQRAKDRKLKPEEYQGGTTAVSNMGMMGVKDFAAVVNPPHATILAVGAGRRVAVVRGDNIEAATVMSVTFSTDHRAVDGALAAQVLQAFKGYIEKPISMLV